MDRATTRPGMAKPATTTALTTPPTRERWRARRYATGRTTATATTAVTVLTQMVFHVGATTSSQSSRSPAAPRRDLNHPKRPQSASDTAGATKASPTTTAVAAVQAAFHRPRGTTRDWRSPIALTRAPLRVPERATVRSAATTRRARTKRSRARANDLSRSKRRVRKMVWVRVSNRMRCTAPKSLRV